MNKPNIQTSGATTLLDVLGVVVDAGYGDQIIVTDDGELRCTKCGSTVSVEDFDVEGFHRLEGASDPDDMLIVVWGACAGCDRGGVVTIGYGPNANIADARVLDALDLDEASADPATFD